MGGSDTERSRFPRTYVDPQSWPGCKPFSQVSYWAASTHLLKLNKQKQRYVGISEYGRIRAITAAVALNSFPAGRFKRNFTYVIFKLILMIHGWGISWITLRWISLDLTDDKSTLVQVMVWCRQATGNYLIECITRYMSPYGIASAH